MGTNVNGIESMPQWKTSDYAAQTTQQEKVTVQVDEKPAGVTDPINEKGLKVQANAENEDPVASFNEKTELMQKQNKQILKNLGIDDPNDPLAESKKALKKAGVEAKGLEYTGTYKDFIQPKTYEETLYRYRQMKYNGQIKLKDKKTGELRDLTDDEVVELTNLRIENDKKIKDIYDNHHVFMDKAEYEQKEGEKSAYMQELMDKGVSKEEAQKKADAKYGVNNYLHGGLLGSKARRFIEKHPELFNENGKFSEEKLKDFVFKAANCLNGNNDAESAYMSLNERREFREMCKKEGINISVDTVGKLAKAIGMEKEYNPTFWLRTGAVVVAAGTGAAIGAATGLSLVAGTVNACGQVCDGLIIPGAVVGAATGAAAGTAATPFLAAKGRKDDHIPAIRPQIQEYVPEPEKPVEPEQTCENSQWDEKVCKNTVARGSSWAYYAENSGITINGKKPAGKVLNAYLYAQQLMYGIKNPKGLKENRFLPVGAEYVQHSDFSRLFNDEQIMSKYGNILNVLKDAKIDTSKCVELNGRIGGRTPQGFRYGGTINNQTQIAHFDQDCKTNKITVTYQ